MQKHSGTMNDESVPVIVGVGQVLDRNIEGGAGLDPFRLICKAIEFAANDAGSRLLGRIDSLDIEHITSTSYQDITSNIRDYFDFSLDHSAYHAISGDSPIRNLGEICNRIAQGKSRIAILCGGEAEYSAKRERLRAKTHGETSLNFQNRSVWKPDLTSLVRQYHLDVPVRAYALYENACRSRWRQSFWESQFETGELQAEAARVASSNPFAWSNVERTIDEIITPSSKNRLLAWPYTKLMVANNTINCGTAIILTNLSIAKELHIDPSKIIYVHTVSHASEPADILARDCYYHSAAMEAVFDAIFRASGLCMKDMDYTEIYNCFPCVVKMAKRILAPSQTQKLTVTGGMTFCRGQFSNYMSQAIVSMVAALRKRGQYGLLYGNGHYLTHAAAAIISTVRPATSQTIGLQNCQNIATAYMHVAPILLERYEGMATVETYTIIFDQTGQPLYALVVGRTPKNERFVARTKTGDSNGYIPFLDTSSDLIGCTGRSVRIKDYNLWVGDWGRMKESAV